MANPQVIATTDNRPGTDWVPLTLSGGDLDLTDPAGPTGGKVARSLYVGGAGIVKFDSLTGTARAPTMIAGSYLTCHVTKVYSSGNGTTATLLFAIL